MLAIMGPSGSGKTTLLDTLAGRLSSKMDVTGDIQVNGHKAQLAYGQAAYVTQDEMMYGTLTVRETLMFSALLRLPPSMPHQEKVCISSHGAPRGSGPVSEHHLALPPLVIGTHRTLPPGVDDPCACPLPPPRDLT